jgi:tetratricopeptide (TPR) repeat protein
MYQLDDDLERAKPLYLRALELNPKEPMAHNNLGLIFEAQGNVARAEEYYRTEIELNPNFSLAYRNLARLVFQEGKIDEARELWLQNWQLEPQNADSLIAYALSFQESDPAKFQQLKDQLIAQGVPPAALESGDTPQNVIEAEK